MQNIVKGGSLV